MSKEDPTLSHMQALEQLTKQLGFNTYAALRANWSAKSPLIKYEANKWRNP